MFTRKFKVPEYGWEVELYDPTIEESDKLAEPYNARDWPKVYQAFAPLIAVWNCTDRQNNILSIDAEGVSKLPFPVLRFLVQSLNKAIFQDVETKNTSAS